MILTPEQIFAHMETDERIKMLKLLRAWDEEECRSVALNLKLTKNELDLLAAGQRLPAIKAIRDRTGERLLTCSMAATIAADELEHVRSKR
jgi:hypothetical protein